MKRTFITIMAAAAVLASCDTKEVETRKGEGTFMLQSLTADTDLKDVQVGTKALPGELNENQLIANMELTIKNTQDANLKQTFNYLDIVNKPVQLATGSYTVSAVSAGGKDAAWDQPLLSGSTNFEVKPNTVSPVKVLCGLTNAVVSIKCSDTFTTEVSDYNIKVSDAKGNFLTWTKENIGNDGYFTANELNVTIEGKRSLDGNSTATVTGTIKNIQAKDHIILNIDAKVTGQVQNITLKVDGTVNQQDITITVDDFEEIEIPDPSQPDPTPTPDPEEPEVDPNAPSLVWIGNENFERTEMTSGMDVTFSISAPNKIASFVVVVNAPAVNSEVAAMVSPENVNSDGTVNLDLIKDDVAMAQLSALGLKTGDQLENQSQVQFELSRLIGMLYRLCGTDPDKYDNQDQTFTLKLTDTKNLSLSKSVVFFYKKQASTSSEK